MRPAGIEHAQRPARFVVAVFAPRRTSPRLERRNRPRDSTLRSSGRRAAADGGQPGGRAASDVGGSRSLRPWFRWTMTVSGRWGETRSEPRRLSARREPDAPAPSGEPERRCVTLCRPIFRDQLDLPRATGGDRMPFASAGQGFSEAFLETALPDGFSAPTRRVRRPPVGRVRLGQGWRKAGRCRPYSENHVP